MLYIYLPLIVVFFHIYTTVENNEAHTHTHNLTGCKFLFSTGVSDSFVLSNSRTSSISCGFCSLIPSTSLHNN